MRDRPSFQTYYAEIERRIADKLRKERAEYLLAVDPDEYLDYLVKEAEWQPLEWYEDEMTIESFMAKVQNREGFDGRTYSDDVPRFRLRIPVSPHPQRQLYLEHLPSSRRRSGEPDWKFEGDVLVIEVDADERAVESMLDNVRFWLGGRNRNIEKSNQTLRDRIRPIWEAKRADLERKHGATQSVLQKLNIPLYQDPNARAKPVEIKPRPLQTVVERPKPRARLEPALNHDHVVALVDFIEQYARQFEIAPRTYAKFKEEELRDLLIGMMNVNYPGHATGETFSSLGKTDVSFRVTDGQVLIAECKYWPGPKEYSAALDQLFRYLTWRQSYGLLITFCRLKDMSRAVEGAKQAMREHPSWSDGSLRERSESRFVTRHQHPQDPQKSVEVHHLFFDLSR